MAGDIKTTDNISVDKIGTMPTRTAPNIEPNTKTLIDRYVFASNFCKNQRVLDWACGWGYGSKILQALGATEVQGLDIDEQALEYAAKDTTTTVNFGKGNITEPVKDGDPFDVVVSIETFEHVPKDTVQQMLTNFKTVCKPGGTIIITTPQRFTPTFTYNGGTHLYEYSLQEFVTEISSVFTTFELYYAVEFRHHASNELNTVFTKNPEWANSAAVMVAVITND